MAAVALGAVLTAPQRVAAFIYSGKVVRVIDGDTLSLRTDQGETVGIRLSDIDAPDGGQAHGPAAKRTLHRLVKGHRIVARVNDTDQYGRAVARIDLGGVDVNGEMVRCGAAWAYTRYQTDGRFPIWERQAWRAHLGLWNGNGIDAVPPWEWRARRRGVDAVGTTAQAIRLTSRQASSMGRRTNIGPWCVGARRCRVRNQFGGPTLADDEA